MKKKDDSETWIYGFNPVLEAIKSGNRVSAVYLSIQRDKGASGIAQPAAERNIPVRFEDRSFFDARFPKGHQCVAASVKRVCLVSLEELMEAPGKADEPAFFVILDCIEDPRNFGAIIRCVDAAGAHGIVFQSHRSAGLTPLVAKASAGALEHANLVEIVNVKHAIEKMKKNDILIVGAEAGSKRTPWDVDLTVPIAIVLGSEGRGLRRTVGEMCDLTVSLPMKGGVNSLNVSVAAGILSYEIARQRSGPA
jgi:23S rRNA (guanosine2251-2'-O)-methyltransferase